MSVGISDKALAARLNRQLERAKAGQADALSKLSSGTVFTAEDPRPSERALSDKMEFRLRSLSSAKRNINDSISLMQTAESGMNEISNIVVRMKEINTAASSNTLSDQERRFLFVEYEALRDEVDRIAKTTEFNGIPILNGESDQMPDEMVLRVGDPNYDENGFDINEVRLENMRDIIVTADGLGLMSAGRLLADSNADDGISVEDAREFMEAREQDFFATIYDEASYHLTKQRSVFGALQSRMQRAIDYVDVYHENLTAAKSKIADTDYAETVVNLVQSQLRGNTTTALMAQANIVAGSTISLLQALL